MDEKTLILHYRTSGTTAPLSKNMTEGEIAISMDNENPKLYTKKNNGDIAEFVDRIFIMNQLAIKLDAPISGITGQLLEKTDNGTRWIDKPEVVRTKEEYVEISTSGNLIDAKLIKDIIDEDEAVTSSALNDINNRLINVTAEVATIHSYDKVNTDNGETSTSNVNSTLNIIGDNTVHTYVNEDNVIIGSLLKISATTPTESNIREQYVLMGNDGQSIGDTIKIYNDSSLHQVYLGHVDDTLVDPTSPEHVDGSGDTALCFVYHYEDQTYGLVPVNVSKFLEETEFKDGFIISDNHEVRIKIDNDSEPYLSVSPNGLKLSGLTNILTNIKAYAKISDGTHTGIAATSADTITISGDTYVAINVSGNSVTLGTNILDTVGDFEILEDYGFLPDAKVIKDVIEADEHAMFQALNDLNVRVDELSGRTLPEIVSNLDDFIDLTESGKLADAKLIRDIIDEDEDVIGAALNDLNERIVEVSAKTETDPIFTNSPAYTITNDDIDYWNNKVDMNYVTELSGTVEENEVVTAKALNDINGRIVELSAQSSTYVISALTPSSENVKEEYGLIGKEGTPLGTTVKIYKDATLYRTYIGHVDDRLTSDIDPTVIDGTGDTALCFIHILANGKYSLTAVDASRFFEEEAFQKGLEVINHAVNVKIDNTSEPYLTVSNDGLKLSGLTNILSNIKAYNKLSDGVNTSLAQTSASTITISGDTYVNITLSNENFDINSNVINDYDDFKDLSSSGSLVDAYLVHEIIKEDEKIASTAFNDINLKLIEISAKTETDPIFTNSPAYTITNDNIIYWNNKIDNDDVITNKEDFSEVTDESKLVNAVTIKNVILENEGVTAKALNDVNNNINKLSGSSLQTSDITLSDTLTSGVEIGTLHIKNQSYVLKAPQASGGTSDYQALANKPQINGVQLLGNKSLSDIGVTNAINTAVASESARTETSITNAIASETARTESTYIKIADLNKSKLLELLGGTEETWNFIDESGNTSTKKIIVLN